MTARRGTATLSALLVLSCRAGGPPAPVPSAAAAAAAHPALAAEPSHFDFGRVLPGRSREKAFVLRNLGARPLVIESVATDCGCMIVGDYARTLAPGASTTVRVLLQLPAHPGEVVRTLVVRPAGAPPLELRLRATVAEESPGLPGD